MTGSRKHLNADRYRSLK